MHDAEQVDVDQLLPLRPPPREEAPAGVDPGVVHERVEPPEPLQRPLEQRGDLLAAPDVGRDRERRDPLGGRGFGGALDLVPRPRRQDDVRSRLGQRLDHGPADPPPGARHERDPPLELPSHHPRQRPSTPGRIPAGPGGKLDPIRRGLVDRRLSALPPPSVTEASPLAPAMRPLWLARRLHPGAALGMEATAVHLRGALDSAALEQALAALHARHDALRLTFHADSAPGAGPTFRVHPTAAPTLARRDVSHLAPADLAAFLEAEARRDLDGSRAPVSRWTLLRRGPAAHVLLGVTPHAALDGAALLRDLPDDLLDLYARAHAGEPLDTAPPGSFAALAREAARAEAARDHAPGLAFWREHLADAPAALELPLGHPRPRRPATASRRATRRVARPVRDALAAHAQTRLAGLADAVLAGWATVLGRHAGAPELVVGVPYSSRRARAGVLGCFLHFTPLRVALADAPSLDALLVRLRDERRRTFPHRQVPIDQVIAACAPPRDPARSPLYQVLFSYLPFTSATPRHAAGLELTLERLAVPSLLDLTLHVEDGPDGLELLLEYAEALFAPATADRLLEQLAALLAQAAADPDAPLQRLPWSAPGPPPTAPEPGDLAPVPELLARQARDTPTALALDDGRERLTYAELLQAVRRRAAGLRRRSVGPGDRVALAQGRSTSCAVSLLAVLETGAAYVPLDVSQPLGRLETLLRAARPALVLADPGALADSLAAGQPGPVVAAADTLDACDDAPPPAPPPASAPLPAVEDPAWVIFTSGSTGAPKGVVGTHAGLVNRLRWEWRADPGRPDDAACWKSSLAFVDAVAELLAPLLGGTRVVVADDAQARDGRRLVDLLEAEQVTRLVLVPSLLRVLLEVPDVGRRLRRLRRGVSSGETLPADLVAAFRAQLPHARLLNVYGSTEVSADLTCFDTADLDLDPTQDARVPVGRPLDHLAVVLLDEDGDPLPPGAIGEVCAAGVGLAAGYLDAPDLTRERFVPGPAGWPHVYRTGDRGRWRPDGELELLGRTDRQVKVRGQRVHLEEVEAALAALPGVAEAAVVTREDDGRLELLGFVAPVLPAHRLRDELARRLPSGMVPNRVLALDRLPRGPAGKVDRPRLPAVAQPPPPTPAAPPTAGRDALERRLMALCRAALGLELRSVFDDFVAWGADSIDVLRLVVRLEQEYGAAAPSPQQVLELPTVAALARLLGARPSAVSASCLRPLRVGAADRPPLFLCHGVTGGLSPVANLVPLLPEDLSVIGVALGDRPVPPTLEDLAVAYLEEIREVQPEGPYLLCGYSWGGLLAYELAYQLTIDHGAEVALLAVIDTHRGPRRGRGSHWVFEQVRRWERLGRHRLPEALRRVLSAGRRDLSRLGRSSRARSSGHGSGRTRHGPPPTPTPDLLRLAYRYARPKAPVAVDLFRSGPPRAERTWARVAARGLRVHPIPGRHLDVLSAPDLDSLSALLAQRIAAALASLASPKRQRPRQSRGR